ncbi:uncharacterized protein LOC134540630 isoform X2 [Bacillus rossius redtenbacheri]|uniref:uncharacterized protein LOC134540630 isoform X2 n=1 Tax=Bacillus rossius redtenbacheri TaxID=93214 RepID=UPI002FDCD171
MNVKVNDLDGLIISAVRKHPLLYNRNNIYYRDNSKKEKAWLSVGKEVGISELQARQRWLTIRDNFMRYYRRKRLEEREGRAVSPSQYMSHYHSMMWYLDFRTIKKRTYRKIAPKPEPPSYHLTLEDATMSLGGVEEVVPEQPSCTSSGQFSLPVDTQMDDEDGEDDDAGGGRRRDDLLYECMRTITQAVRDEARPPGDVNPQSGSFMQYLEQLVRTVRPELQDELEKGVLDFVFSFKKKHASGS